MTCQTISAQKWMPDAAMSPSRRYQTPATSPSMPLSKKTSGIGRARRQPRADRGARSLDGAMDALRATADGMALRAIIADGAGAGTFGDLAILDGQGLMAPIALSGDWLSMRAAELLSSTREPPALASTVGKIRVPVLLVASNNPGELATDQAYRERIGAHATL